MFGYIVPDKPELKIKEYILFRAYYCGLCKSMGRQFSQISRLLLNYDITFLGLILSSTANDLETIRFETCIVNPVQKRAIVCKNHFIDFSAPLNVILAYYKMKDDWEDERKLSSLGEMAILRSAYIKASKNSPQMVKLIRKRIEELHTLEKQECNSMDETADVFGKLIRDILLSFPMEKADKDDKIFSWFGYNIGKWIYLLDAYDDIEKDIKRKSYNVLLKQYHYNGEAPNIFKDKIREDVKFNLIHTLGQTGKAYDLIDLKKNASLTQNIIYSGMYKKTEEILTGRSCSKYEQSLSNIGDKRRCFRQ